MDYHCFPKEEELSIGRDGHYRSCCRGLLRMASLPGDADAFHVLASLNSERHPSRERKGCLSGTGNHRLSSGGGTRPPFRPAVALAVERLEPLSGVLGVGYFWRPEPPQALQGS